MNRQISLLTRALLVCAMIMVALQGAANSQPVNKAAKIDEVMTAANKYRLFNGAVLVAEDGKVIYKKGLAWRRWNGISRTPSTPDFGWARSPNSSPPR